SVRRRAAEAAAIAAPHNPAISPALLALLATTAPRARFGAAYALGLIGGDAFDLRAGDALYEALGDSDGDVRWAAHDLIMRLGGIYPARILAGLLALAHDGSPDARKMALYCLRDLAPAGAEVLHAASLASGAGNTHVRLASLAILARLPAYRREASTIAMRMLSFDANPGVRRAAAAALGLISDAAAPVLEALGRAARDEADPALARAARAALKRLRDNAQETLR
ncbi:MAG: HEAT repeat domain-containing protein, partial [Candidatus Binataceae bacterium]